MKLYEEFIMAIESYYFGYTDFVRDIVLIYIKKTFNECDLKKVFSLVTKNYSRQYKCTPDVAIIDDIVKKYNKENDYPGERIEYKGQIIYITDDPAYAHLFETMKQIEDKTGDDI